MIKKTVMISAVAAAVMATTAFAQTTPADKGSYGQSTTTNQGAGAASFATLDANRDGRVSQTEAAMHAELSGAFQTVDSNSDGSLSQSEFTKWSKDAEKSGSKSSTGSRAPTTSAPSDKTPGTMSAPATTEPDTSTSR